MVLYPGYYSTLCTKIDAEKYNMLRITLEIDVESYSVWRIVLNSEYGKYSKSCRRH